MSVVIVCSRSLQALRFVSHILLCRRLGTILGETDFVVFRCDHTTLVILFVQVVLCQSDLTHFTSLNRCILSGTHVSMIFFTELLRGYRRSLFTSCRTLPRKFFCISLSLSSLVVQFDFNIILKSFCTVILDLFILHINHISHL